MNKNDDNRITPRNSNKRFWKWIIAMLVFAFIIGLVLYENSPSPWKSPSISDAMSQHDAEAVRQNRESAAEDVQAVKPPVSLPQPQPITSSTGETEVCGVGRVKLDAGHPFSGSQYAEALVKKAGARWAEALLASDDNRALAVGLFLRAGYFDDINGADKMLLAKQSSDALVQLATGTRDPAIYAMAAHMCRTYENQPMSDACEHISISEWTRIDPDNAVPWLMLAGQAQSRSDISAETAAFNRAAKSHRVDFYGKSLYAFSQALLPDDLTPLERMLLTEKIIGIEAAWARPDQAEFRSHCSIQAVQDNGVRQTCSSLANVFVSKATTTLDIAVGNRVGKLSGWSQDRTNSLADENAALLQAQETATGNDSTLTCDNVQRINNYFTQSARMGELQFARDALARSGETAHEMALKYRARMEEDRAKTEELIRALRERHKDEEP